jgi:hypothetical protein
MRKCSSNRNLIFTTRLLQLKSEFWKVVASQQNKVNISTSYLWLRCTTLLYPSTHYLISRTFRTVIPSLQQRSYVFLYSKLDVVHSKSNASPQFDFTCQLRLPKFSSSSSAAGDFPLFLALGPMSGGICCNSLQAVSNNSKPLSQAWAYIFPARTTCIALVINRVVL